MNDFAIETVGLRRSYHGRPALSGLDMRVPLGSIWGFLGRNGAGKTTTLRSISRLIDPRHGRQVSEVAETNSRQKYCRRFLALKAVQ